MYLNFRLILPILLMVSENILTVNILADNKSDQTQINCLKKTDGIKKSQQEAITKTVDKTAIKAIEETAGKAARELKCLKEENISQELNYSTEDIISYLENADSNIENISPEEFELKFKSILFKKDNKPNKKLELAKIVGASSLSALTGLYSIVFLHVYMFSDKFVNARGVSTYRATYPLGIYIPSSAFLAFIAYKSGKYAFNKYKKEFAKAN